MNSVNVNASISNVIQVDRLQADAHRGPIVNQEQNAEVVRREAAQRARAPIAPEKPDGKKTDPDARREEERRKKRCRQPSGRTSEPLAAAHTAERNGRSRGIDFVA